jgi:hypothetical protein
MATLCLNALTTIGVFCPIISVPFVGAQNYFQIFRAYGIAILFLAGVNLLLIVKRLHRVMLFTAGLSFLIAICTFLTLLFRMQQVRNVVDDGMKGSISRGLAEGFLQSVQIQWGGRCLWAERSACWS